MPRKQLLGNVLVDDPADTTGRSKKARTRDGKDYRPSQRRIALFQSANGYWKEADEWPAHVAKVVCRNPHCRMNGEEVDAVVGENVDGVFRAGCGPCGKEITEMWVEEHDEPLPLEPPAGFSVPSVNVRANLNVSHFGKEQKP